MKFYAHKTEKGYRDIYPSEMQVGMCGDQPIIPIQVTEDENGEYWGWKQADDNKICMIWPSFVQLQICFPYGIDAAEKHGEGKRVKLHIQE